ncbi:MAG: type II toxin-antitoxin system death-on-curing family toxin [Solirubrobacteraceae bacterium]
MPVYYPEFGDFCDVAADILGITSEQIARLPNVGLAESALAAPRAGFGDVEVYPTILEKAAILLERLARNHPLPDGNKRTAFFLAGLFLEANGLPLCGAQPHTDVPMVERIAAGQIEHGEVLEWLSTRTATGTA